MKYYIEKFDSFSEEKRKDFLLHLDREKKREFLSATNENRKLSILISQGFAKEKISEEYNIPKSEIIFSVSDRGKPYCKSHPHIYFSLSHSGNFVALAISDKEVGIDIEKFRPAKENLINRICSQNEIDAISLSKKTHIKFTEIWTKKEAYLKALGTGIDRELSSIDTTDKNLNFVTEINDEFIVSVFSL